MPYLTKLANDIELYLTGRFGVLSEFSKGYLCGTVYSGHKQLVTADLSTQLQQAVEDDALNEFLSELNGFFFLIFRHAGCWYLCADKLRSRPLFYCFHERKLIVSDSAEILCNLLNPFQHLALTAEEFSHTGYVTGEDTLIEGLYQVPSSSYVSVRQSKTECHSYFSFKASSELAAQEPGQNYFAKLDTVLSGCISRLIDYANGRQIVLPLSGGYDSRALAAQLKKSGYANILCFAFGRPGSPELKKSAEVAAALCLPWIEVTYSRREWQQFSATNEFKSFLQFIHSKVSVPNIQVLLALHKLKNIHLIEPDAVFVPGHTADFVSGGHIPVIAGEGGLVKKALSSTVKTHFALSKEPLTDALNSRLTQQLENLSLKWNLTTAEQLCEAWNFSERQAKFIVNSNRYYDFYAYDWWMPFWDNEFVEFWQQVPIQLRKDKFLWISFVNYMMDCEVGEEIVRGNADIKANRWLARFHRYTEYWTDANALYALVPFKRWITWRLGISKRSGNIFSWLADKCLAALSEDKK